ncbi:hypothetical protein [Natronomonas marina]|uniref:hypothetical protein n=1 Tax=Natronomonas marina TaxID=2961939 RepID=UPI0020C99277|nr:hypothetical protein [Natronomonas marina]
MSWSEGKVVDYDAAGVSVVEWPTHTGEFEAIPFADSVVGGPMSPVPALGVVNGRVGWRRRTHGVWGRDPSRAEA